ncbi:hypothetical protein TcG_12720 [Trypanosoma cruzi]|nr:hypothetical protein TcG_12720 [Trypanosoma cruzi]
MIVAATSLARREDGSLKFIFWHVAGVQSIGWCGECLDKCGLLRVQLLHVPMCLSYAVYTLVRDSRLCGDMCVGRVNSKTTGESVWALRRTAVFFCIPLVDVFVCCLVCADAWQKRPP